MSGPTADPLDRAYARVRVELSSAADRLSALGMPHWEVRGRCLRPLAAYAGAPDLAAQPGRRDALWSGALAIQLAHEASLVHDDVIDAASERRGAPTVAHRAGVPAALVLGDHLLTSAYRAAAMTADVRFMTMFARAVERTVAGERRQADLPAHIAAAGAWRDVLLGKSGELFGCALATGAVLRGDPDHGRLLELGRRLGLLYQMHDDLLDYAPLAVTGKTPLRDYRAEQWTWPLLEAADLPFGRSDREVLETMFGGPGAPALRSLERIEVESDELSRDLARALGPGTSLAALVEEWRCETRAAVRREAARVDRATRAGSWLRAESSDAADTGVSTSLRPPPGRSEWERYLGRHGRSFRFASSVLPPRERRQIASVYAWCRYTDDLVDHGGRDGNGDGAGGDDAADAVLDDWLRLSRQAYELQHTGVELLDGVMRATRDAQVPFAYVAELIAGMRMDVRHRRYGDRAELGLYTWRAAGTVGLWLAELYGVRDPWALERAAALGQAMQLTNILRDVGEDLGRDRLYLPLDVLRAHGLSVNDLTEARRAGTTPGARWPALVEELIADAERDYQRAAEALDVLPAAFRRAVAVASSVYAGIHDAIRANAYDTLNRRAATTVARKFSLGARALLRFRAGRPRAQTAGAWARLLAAEPA